MTTDDAATFVLVPGAGGSAWDWHRLVPELEALGHVAVPVDLPAADDGAGLEAYADVVLDAIGDRDRVVLVAASMGALTAVLVAARRRVDLLVLVNAMVPRPGESGGEWWEATGQAEARAALAARQGRPVSDEVDVLTDFFADVPADVTAEAMALGAPDQSARPFADPLPIEGWPDVPTRVIAGRDDRFFPADFQRRVAEERLGITPDVLPGGHLLALSQPVALARRLDAAWRDVTTGALRSA